MSDTDLLAAQTALAKKYGAPADEIERQIFLCALSEKQKCCSRAEGEVAWQFLKDRLKEKGLAKKFGVAMRVKTSRARRRPAPCCPRPMTRSRAPTASGC